MKQAASVRSGRRGTGSEAADRSQAPGGTPAPVEAAPLSSAQERLYFLHQLDPTASAYNIGIAVRLTGELHVAALAAAITRVAERHESLRTTFPLAADGRPRQVVHEPKPVPLPVTYVHGDEDEALLEAVRAEEDRPFDLTRGPVFRARLLRVGADHVLTLTAHHLVVDGWGLSVLRRELSALYQEYTGGPSAELVDPVPRFTEHARAQRARLTPAVLERGLAYWESELRDAPPTDLPTDRPRPQRQTFAGASVRTRLPAETAAALDAFAAGERTTRYAVLLAALQAVLARHTGRTDVVVGCVTAGRDDAAYDVVGFFANTIAVRGRLEDDPSFRTLVRRARRTMLKALRHQEIPFDLVVGRVLKERDPSRNPLFQVAFISQEFERAELRLGGLELSAVETPVTTSRFDLELTVSAREDGSELRLVYNTDLFDRETAEAMLGRFTRFLGGALATPDASVFDVDLIAPDERRRLLVDWNTTVAPDAATTLVDLVAAQTARSPAAVAVADDRRSLTYAELDAESARLANHLRARGVRRGTLVGLCLSRSAELMVALLGILRAGGTYLPLDERNPPRRIADVLARAGARLVVAESATAGVLPPDVERVLVDADADEIAAQPETPPYPGTTPADHVYVMFTSGSTGRPKGVAIPHSAVANFLLGASEYIDLGSGTTMLQLSPPTFDGSTLDFWGPLVAGGKVVLAPVGRLLEDFPEVVRRHGVDTVLMMSPQLDVVVERGLDQLDGITQLLVGGDVVTPATFDRVREHFGADRRLGALYGPTETTVWCTFHPASERPRRDAPVAIGRPVPGARIYLLDDELRLVPAGVVGEIFVGGACVGHGYVGDPRQTAERFVPDPFDPPGARLYRTGDHGRHLRDGTIEFHGRIDKQVKIRGYRVELGEIERVAVEHPAVAQCVVVPVDDDGVRARSLAAYVVPSGEARLDTDEIRRFVRERLPAYMVPRDVIRLEAIPLTPNGKVDRRALPAPRRDGGTAVGPLRTPTEEVLAELWSAVLGLERVGVEDDFFDLGGHSLLAMQVIARARAVFGVDIPLRLVFDRPVLGDLAAAIDDLRRESSGMPPRRLLPAAGEDVPLSFGQERLWFLQQLDPDSIAYNVPLAFSIRGDLRLRALERSLEELLRRHETLRTAVAVEGERPRPRLVEPPPVRLVPHDLRPAADPRAEAARLIAEDRGRPFDLSVAPVVRTQLFRVADDEHVLGMVIHHIACDGWSLRIVRRELALLYDAFVRGDASPLQEPEIRYADYAAWQRAWAEAGALDTQLEHWRRELDGLEPLSLPTDHPRGARQDDAGGSVAVQVTAETTGRLLELSRENGATPFMTLLAVYQVLLSRYSQQTDLAVGSAVSQRPDQRLENVVGFFVNTLVLRADLGGEPSFRELLRRTRERALGAYANQDVPFEQLVSVLEVDRDLARNPLFQVAFSFGRFPEEPPGGDAVTAAGIEVDLRSVRFDLELDLWLDGDELAGELRYRTRLFESETARRLARHFTNLCAEVAARPDDPITELRLLDRGERRTILDEWNATDTPYDARATIDGLVAAQAARTPAAPAAVDDERRLTYADLEREAAQLAQHLRALGVGRGSVVGVCVPRSVRLMVALLGILRAGGTYLPLDPANPEQRVAELVARAGTGVVVAESSTAGVVPPEVERVLLDEDAAEIARRPAAPPVADTGPDDLAYILFTSGSTGRPKGVGIPHGAVANLVLGARSYVDLGPTHAMLQLSPATFDASTLEFWGPLVSGGTVVLADPGRLLERLPDVVRQHAVTTVLMISPQLDLVVERGFDQLDGIEQLLVGGDVVTPATFDRVHDAFGEQRRLIACYGPTETTLYCTIHPSSERMRRDAPVALGRPIPGTRLYVLDERLEPAPIGVVGEIFVGGACVGRGYVGDPRQTAERFVPDPFGPPGSRLYRTGDRGRYLPEGIVEFAGRIDGQVKIRGYRVELGEVERVIADHPGVAKCVALPVDEKDGRAQALVAYVVPARGGRLDGEEVRRAIRDRLPGYMVPADVVVVDEIPLTRNGKADRRALPAPHRLHAAETTAPRTPLEASIARLWSETLGVDDVDVHAPFFDVGGHSLRAAELMARVRDTLQLELPLRLVFDAPTVAEFAAAVAAAAERVPETDGAWWSAAGKRPASRIESHTVDTVRGPRRVDLYLSPGWSADGASALVVVLDGAVFADVVRLPAILDHLVESRALEPLAALFVDNGRGDERERELLEGAGFVDLLADELVPWAWRRLGARPSPEATAVAGSSAGAVAALLAALRRPDAFRRVLAQSGAFGVVERELDAALAASLAPLRIHLAAGSGETRPPAGAAASILVSTRRLRDALAAAEHAVTYEEHAGGHNYVVWQQTFPQGLVELLR